MPLQTEQFVYLASSLLQVDADDFFCLEAAGHAASMDHAYTRRKFNLQERLQYILYQICTQNLKDGIKKNNSSGPST